MKMNKKLVFICIAVPLLVGAVSGVLTRNAMEMFSLIRKPSLAPPAWLFPVAWTILYTLMGISSYLILTAPVSSEEKEDAMVLYRYQLIVNFLWPTFFFSFSWYFFSFLWLVLLWVLVLFMILKFRKISSLAAYLNIPYLLWLTFAGYLNFSIWLLN